MARSVGNQWASPHHLHMTKHIQPAGTDEYSIKIEENEMGEPDFHPPSNQSQFVGLDTICVSNAQHEQRTLQGRIRWLLWLSKRIISHASKHIVEVC
ncbi:uncharacterized protein N7484_008535 [Penicillium longicatenatum]|uniref:uncharacterized protein n=1 Tax=Penicillium longicatenatum TaxID=1561947 RepID=UPI002546BDE2|nr:uncharacterized protein N7484_008535 [Penicillium longicatenatum]KAJ5635222.1 hypothetical protein N7484_008535 [Penicillium longicatenatum]